MESIFILLYPARQSELKPIFFIQKVFLKYRLISQAKTT
jgi:hypothetical protein